MLLVLIFSKVKYVPGHHMGGPYKMIMRVSKIIQTLTNSLAILPFSEFNSSNVPFTSIDFETIF